jgi:protoheme IX farnesyltransferase
MKMDVIRQKLKLYWPLIKSLQTGLLLVTGFTGYISVRCPVLNLQQVVGLLGSLFLTISGSTILNMVYDRDIDARMNRTRHRPLPAGKIKPGEALAVGLIVSAIGLLWAFSLSAMFGWVVFAGLFIDVVVYTIWLKRRTAWSIVWGGLSGGMPILAGRVLGLGYIDYIGILLALAILLWIPTHILTFSIRYRDDYRRAGVPTFPSTYGIAGTQRIIAISSIGAAIAIGTGIYALGLSWGYLRLFSVLTVGLVGLSLISLYRPSEQINFGLFKYASLFMLGSMMMVVLGAMP